MTRTTPFSAKAIRNACIAAAFAVPPVGFIGLAAIGNAVGPAEETKTAQAAKPLSNVENCLKSKQQMIELTGDGSAFDCEAAASNATPLQLIKQAKAQKLGFQCKQSIKAALKDPGSYREVNREYLAVSLKEVAVRMTYTATNGFGGRIQNTQVCSYSL